MCGATGHLDRIVEVCRRHQVLLIEDAAQALGAHWKGRSLGTIGQAGCFSFDYVKTVTCAEGGAVLTDDPEVYRRADAFSDHGHDHLGADRGADQHPHLGTNYRISELHAAVGLAQLRKLDRILQTQRQHQKLLKEGLAGLSNLEFRELPDPEGDSATFLTFFLPSEADARQATRALAAAGVDGCFYWYDNNWHYHRQWTHLKQPLSPAPLAVKEAGWAPDWAQLALPQSDAIMARAISMLIKLSWSPQEIQARLERMRAVLAG
jgi:8-amino-3,8-dideoxy-alpha-D-manno-octulosonate transaminase